VEISLSREGLCPMKSVGQLPKLAETSITGCSTVLQTFAVLKAIL